MKRHYKLLFAAVILVLLLTGFFSGVSAEVAGTLSLKSFDIDFFNTSAMAVNQQGEVLFGGRGYIRQLNSDGLLTKAVHLQLENDAQVISMELNADFSSLLLIKRDNTYIYKTDINGVPSARVLLPGFELDTQVKYRVFTAQDKYYVTAISSSDFQQASMYTSCTVFVFDANGTLTNTIGTAQQLEGTSWRITDAYMAGETLLLAAVDTTTGKIRLYKLDNNNMVKVNEVSNPSSSGGTVPVISGMTVSSAKYIYLPTLDGTVVRFNEQGGFISKVKLSSFIRLAVDGKGDLYADSGEKVIKYLKNGAKQKELPYLTGTALNVCSDAQEGMYVNLGHTIIRLDSENSVTAIINKINGIENAVLDSITTDASGKLYIAVSGGGNKYLAVVDGETATVRMLAEKEVELTGEWKNIQPDITGKYIYISTIARFNTENAKIEVQNINQPDEIKNACHMAIGAGNVSFTLTAEGKLFKLYGGKNPSELVITGIENPTAITADKDGGLIIGTRDNGLYRFNADGTYAGQWQDIKGIKSISAVQDGSILILLDDGKLCTLENGTAVIDTGLAYLKVNGESIALKDGIFEYSLPNISGGFTLSFMPKDITVGVSIREVNSIIGPYTLPGTDITQNVPPGTQRTITFEVKGGAGEKSTYTIRIGKSQEIKSRDPRLYLWLSIGLIGGSVIMGTFALIFFSRHKRQSKKAKN